MMHGKRNIKLGSGMSAERYSEGTKTDVMR
jgi:hypothetical protein